MTDDPRPFTARDPIKGRKSRAAGGYLGAVGAARFYAEHQMIINNINYGLAFYWAENAEYPQSHDEFMKKIVEFNQLNLPEIPAGQEYIYVPEEPEQGLQIRLKQSDSKVEP